MPVIATLKRQTGKSEVQTDFQPHSEFQASLAYRKHDSKQSINQSNQQTNRQTKTK